MGLSVFVLPVSYAIRYLVYAPLGIKDGFFTILSVLTTLVGLVLYYKWTEKSTFFLRKGYYWVENGTVFIQRGTKIRAIMNVDWLKGTDTFSYDGRVPMLIVTCGKKKTMLYAKTIPDEVDFSRTELSPIFNLILENNPKLVQEENLPYWYEVRK